MSCMIAPPANAHLGRHTRDCDTWVEYQNMQSQLDPHEIVEDCEGMYEDAYDRVSKRDRDGLLLSDLQRDLAKMSNQPAIRYAYRRFVIIGSNADVHGRPDEEGWVSSRSAVLHFQVANVAVTPSASGPRFQGLALAKKIASVSRSRYIMSFISRRSNFLGGLSRERPSGHPDQFRSRRSFRTTSTGSLPNGVSTVLLPPSPLPGSSQAENHQRSLRPWITDYRLRLTTSHTPPLPHPLRLQTTRPTTMTSSTNIPQIIPRTRATKLSTFIHRTSPMPLTPNTAEARPSLSTTRASLPFPINQSGTTLRLHLCRPLRRNRHGHFGRRFRLIP